MATTPWTCSEFICSDTNNIQYRRQCRRFLEEVHRFYELNGTQGQPQKTLINAFFSAEAVKRYEDVEDSIGEYPERCRKPSKNLLI